MTEQQNRHLKRETMYMYLAPDLNINLKKNYRGRVSPLFSMANPKTDPEFNKGYGVEVKMQILSTRTLRAK